MLDPDSVHASVHAIERERERESLPCVKSETTLGRHQQMLVISPLSYLHLLLKRMDYLIPFNVVDSPADSSPVVLLCFSWQVGGHADSPDALRGSTPLHWACYG